MTYLNNLERACLTIGGLGGISLMLYQLGNQNANMINDNPHFAIGTGISLGVAVASHIYRDHRENKRIKKELLRKSTNELEEFFVNYGVREEGTRTLSDEINAGAEIFNELKT